MLPTLKNIAKIDENIRKMQKKLVDNTVFAEELPDSSVFIDVIGSHWCHRLIIGYYRCETRYIAGHRGAKLASATRGHRHPTKGAESSRIVIGFDRSPSVPGLHLSITLTKH